MSDSPSSDSFVPLAIVGLGCLFPKADSTGAYWANVRDGVDCITEVPPTHWRPEDYFDADPKAPDKTYAQRGGFLNSIPFNTLEFGIAPRDIEATDTSQLLGLVAAKMALDDAGIQLGDPAKTPSAGTDTDARNTTKTNTKITDRNRVSVVLGVTGTLELVIPLGARLGHPKWKKAMQEAGIPEDRIQDAVQRISDSYVPWQENSFPGLLGNVVAGRIANRLDLGGTNCVVDAACASSLSAVHLAALELQTHRADVVVTGGIDTFNDIFMFMCFSKTPALSKTGNSRPFDADGDGTILGEGLGVVVLKRLADAQRDGDQIYAILKSVGSSSDGKGNAIYAPSAAGQVKALKTAYQLAGVTPDTIELVEAHGTGTRVGDATEATSLTEVYGASRGDKGRRWCALGSVKSQIGHTKAAAGAASLVKAALALYYKTLPPTLKVTRPVEPLHAEDSPFYINTQKRPWMPRAEHPRRAALSAFGFGGSNFHAVLEEADPCKLEVDWDGSVEIFPLGAATPAELLSRLRQVPTTSWTSFARAAEQARNAYAPAPARLILVAHREQTNLKTLVDGAAQRLAETTTTRRWLLPGSAYFGQGERSGGLAVLFPGQGSQYVGMLRDVACLFPEVLESLTQANHAVAPTPLDGGEQLRLTDVIYPKPRFSPHEREEAELRLRATEFAQPAIGAVSLGAWRVLAERFGVKADAFAGHSYGELTALAAAVRLTADEFFQLSRLRGLLMAREAAQSDGAMLAVFTSRDQLTPLLEQVPGVVIANFNAPSQVVVSGPKAAIEALTSRLQAERIRAVWLPVSAAFHSNHVSAAAEPFRASLETVSFGPGLAPVYANTTGHVYPDDPTTARDLLGFQLAKPVEFVLQIQQMYADGLRTFVEVGPGSVLTRLVERILGEAADIEVFALDSGSGKNSGVLDYARCLARLAASGIPVNVAAWESGSRCRPGLEPKAGATVPVCGANSMLPRPARPALPKLQEFIPTAGPSPSVPSRDGSALMPGRADDLAQALEINRQTLAALQQLQQQTAQLHQQFLQSQEQAQKSLQQLILQQQALLFPGSMPAPLPAAAQPSPGVAPLPPVAPVSAAVSKPMPLATPKPQPSPLPATPSDVKQTDRVRVEATVRPSPPTLRLAASSPAAPAPASSPSNVKAAHSAVNGAATVKHGSTKLASIQQILMAVIAEKTGYPVEMLTPEMTLDSDLGIDSIKRVEILSTLQEKLPDAPVVKPEHLGTLHTLGDIAQFLAGGSSKNPSTVKVPIQAHTLPTPQSTPINEIQVEPGPITTQRLPQDMLPSSQPDPQVSDLLNSVADASSGGQDSRRNVLPVTASWSSTPPPGGATQYGPMPRQALEMSRPGKGMLNLDRVDRSILQAVDLEAAANRPRIVFPEGAEFWLVAANGDPLADELVSQLSTQGYTVKRFPWSDPESVKPVGQPVGLILLAPLKSQNQPINKHAFRWLQSTGPKLRSAAKQGLPAAFFTIMRFDGAFGLGELPTTADPIGGGLAGLVKTARYEWTELVYKSFDVALPFAQSSPAQAAAAVVEELSIAGPIEVGLAHNQRSTLDLARTVRRQQVTTTPPLTSKDVVLVTGGARGVTAEVATALAEVYQPTLILTGRTPLPLGPEPDWSRGLTDEAALKRAIAEHLGASASPKSVGEYYARLIAQREIANTLRRIEQAGSRVAYFAVNVSNGRQVADLLHQIQVKFGPVNALVHGAGVLADRKIEDLTAEQFDAVYSTKVDGLRIILDLLANQELKAIVLFSSTTGRFGRLGQLAYAVANEVLNKIAQVEARKRPNSRIVAINWGPWEGGMVTPALRKVFESEGIGLIPLPEGGLFAVQELTAAGRAVEVIALGKPGSRPAKPGSGELKVPTGFTGATTSPPATNPPPVELSLAYERTIDIDNYPILRSHVLDGRAVMPMALHLEFLAHAALHHNPGLVFQGVNDFRVTNGILVDQDTTVQLRALAGKAIKHDKSYIVPVELRSKRRDNRDVLHSRAEIILSGALSKPPAIEPLPATQPYSHPVDEVYKYFLFHGTDMQGLEKVEGIAERAIIGTAYPSPPPSEWMTSPLRSSWVADPLALDVSFQMMILWTFAQNGVGNLPTFLGRYRQYRRTFPIGLIRIVCRITNDDGNFARADIDFIDLTDNSLVAQILDYQCLMDRTLDQTFRRNTLAPKARA